MDVNTRYTLEVLWSLRRCSQVDHIIPQWTYTDVHSTSERLWPLPSHLKCCLEYPRVRSSDLSFLYSTLQMYCSLWKTTGFCLMHTRMTRRFLGYVTPPRQMSCNTVYLTAGTPCHRGWQLIIYSWTMRRQKRSGVHLLAISTRFRPHICSSRLHICAACHCCQESRNLSQRRRQHAHSRDYNCSGVFCHATSDTEHSPFSATSSHADHASVPCH